MLSLSQSAHCLRDQEVLTRSLHQNASWQWNFLIRKTCHAIQLMSNTVEPSCLPRVLVCREFCAAFCFAPSVEYIHHACKAQNLFEAYPVKVCTFLYEFQRNTLGIVVPAGHNEKLIGLRPNASITKSVELSTPLPLPAKNHIPFCLGWRYNHFLRQHPHQKQQPKC